MKSINIKLLVSILVLFWTMGCSDFLSTSDPSNFTQDNYYTKAEHAESAVSAVYQDLRAVLGGGFGGAPWLMLEFSTGLANTSLGQANNSLIIRQLENTSDNAYGQTYWTSHYRGIANANAAIENIPGIEMDETRKKSLLAEVRFLRAYYYFNLVRIFGEVPLILQSVKLDSPNLYPDHSDVESIYNAIVEDLTTAEVGGLPNLDETGRVTKGAVQALLSKVYLTMAGSPLNKGQSHYTLARGKAKELIDGDLYSLFNNYDDLHQPDIKNRGEFIFSAQYLLPEQSSNGLQALLTPYNRGISAYSAQTGGIFANDEFIESYSSEDKRIQDKEFYYSTFSLAANRSQVVDLGAFHIYKYFDLEAHLESAQSDLNWWFYRYAEVLLIFSEADNEINGPTLAGYDAINQIRNRAELTELANLSKEEFRIAIWKERWHELSYENKTWFDMVRLRKALNVNTGEFEDFVGHKFSYGPMLSEKELLFPIPTSEIRNNDQLKQNTGY